MTMEVKLAVGFDDTLELSESNTPLLFDFVATHYTALIAAKDPSRRISAEVWSDLYGSFGQNGSFGGASKGKLTFHPLVRIWSPPRDWLRLRPTEQQSAGVVHGRKTGS